jgi:hypothetical protein
MRVVGAMAGVGSAAANSALRATGEVLLDPIVFGVVAPAQPCDGEPAVWIPLVAWRW